MSFSFKTAVPDTDPFNITLVKVLSVSVCEPVVKTTFSSVNAVLNDLLTELLLESPINILPSFNAGVAFVLPAPPTLNVKLLFFNLITFPIFCIRLLSPLGGTFVILPLSLALI